MRIHTKNELYRYIHGRNTGFHEQTLEEKFFRLIGVVVNNIVEHQEKLLELEKRLDQETATVRWIGDRGLITIAGKEFTHAFVQTLQKESELEIVVKVGKTVSEEKGSTACCQDGNVASITLRTVDSVGTDTTSIDDV